MTISELVAALNRVQQTAGDIDVVVHDATSGTDSVLQSAEVSIDLTSGSAVGQLTLIVGPAPAAPVQADPTTDTPAA